ncbi:uncharacterized protein [Triticum aestivum]|uniref:uncharacterized protein n=1 Tax=Triticum aestivum TaxID=4565 RepID=UPI001D030F36|nr:uncharacterized protein LOC123138643 [Triticum aestivum]
MIRCGGDRWLLLLSGARLREVVPSPEGRFKAASRVCSRDGPSVARPTSSSPSLDPLCLARRHRSPLRCLRLSSPSRRRRLRLHSPSSLLIRRSAAHRRPSQERSGLGSRPGVATAELLAGYLLCLLALAAAKATTLLWVTRRRSAPRRHAAPPRLLPVLQVHSPAQLPRSFLPVLKSFLPPPMSAGTRGCRRSKALAFRSTKFFQHEVHKDDEVRALFKQVQGEVPGLPIIVMKVASQR